MSIRMIFAPMPPRVSRLLRHWAGTLDEDTGMWAGVGPTHRDLLLHLASVWSHPDHLEPSSDR